jgi:hypothetical protein
MDIREMSKYLATYFQKYRDQIKRAMSIARSAGPAPHRRRSFPSASADE